MYACDNLIGGFDENEGSSLYYLDYLATLQKLNKAAFGYGAYLILTVMDTHWHEGLTLEEGKELAKKCIAEIQKRLIVNIPKMIVKCIDANGIKVLDL